MFVAAALVKDAGKSNDYMKLNKIVKYVRVHTCFVSYSYKLFHGCERENGRVCVFPALHY